jgi:hypothetical protein
LCDKVHLKGKGHKEVILENNSQADKGKCLLSDWHLKASTSEQKGS